MCTFQCHKKLSGLLFWPTLYTGEFTVTSINLAFELVILLIFVNKEHFVNAVTMGKMSHEAKMRMQTLREQGFGAI